MDPSSPSRNAAQLNATQRRLGDVQSALATLGACLEDIERAGACCAPSGFAFVGSDIDSIGDRLCGEGEVVAGIYRRRLDRRTLAEFPAETQSRFAALNERVARLEARLARWLLLETGTARQAVFHSREVRNGTWLRLPVDVGLTIELRDGEHVSGGASAPLNLTLELSGIECQVRDPGVQHPPQAIRVASASPGPIYIEADPEAGERDVCGLLHVIRSHGGLGWEGMLDMELLTARVCGQGAQFVGVV